MVWFCGGHGVCLNPGDAGAALVQKDTLAWLDHFVKANPSVSTGPMFEWLDQTDTYSSNLCPRTRGSTAPLSRLGQRRDPAHRPRARRIGTQPLDVFPYSLTEATKPHRAELTVPGGATTTQIVGTSQLAMTYAGIGTSRDVYAQLVDNKTGLVVGDLVTPVPVILDGRTHTVTVPLEAIAYTMTPSDPLTLQLIGSATDYEDFTAVGVIKISDIQVALPTSEPAPTQCPSPHLESSNRNAQTASHPSARHRCRGIGGDAGMSHTRRPVSGRTSRRGANRVAQHLRPYAPNWLAFLLTT